MGYSNFTFACPFFQWDERLKVHCEGGCRVVFPGAPEANAYLERHCGSVKGWEDCTLARSLVSYYDRLEREARAKKVSGRGRSR